MNFNKHPLSDITKALYELNNLVAVARNAYLLKEAERKHFEASLMMKASGASIAERRMIVEADGAYLEFHKALARLQAVYEYQKFKFEILSKEYQSCYLGLKLDDGLVKKGAE